MLSLSRCPSKKRKKKKSKSSSSSLLKRDVDNDGSNPLLPSPQPSSKRKRHSSSSIKVEPLKENQEQEVQHLKRQQERKLRRQLRIASAFESLLEPPIQQTDSLELKRMEEVFLGDDDSSDDDDDNNNELNSDSRIVDLCNLCNDYTTSVSPTKMASNKQSAAEAATTKNANKPISRRSKIPIPSFSLDSEPFEPTERASNKRVHQQRPPIPSSSLSSDPVVEQMKKPSATTNSHHDDSVKRENDPVPTPIEKSKGDKPPKRDRLPPKKRLAANVEVLRSDTTNKKTVMNSSVRQNCVFREQFERDDSAIGEEENEKLTSEKKSHLLDENVTTKQDEKKGGKKIEKVYIEGQAELRNDSKRMFLDFESDYDAPDFSAGDDDRSDGLHHVGEERSVSLPMHNSEVPKNRDNSNARLKLKSHEVDRSETKASESKHQSNSIANEQTVTPKVKVSSTNTTNTSLLRRIMDEGAIASSKSGVAGMQGDSPVLKNQPDRITNEGTVPREAKASSVNTANTSHPCRVLEKKAIVPPISGVVGMKLDSHVDAEQCLPAVFAENSSPTRIMTRAPTSEPGFSVLEKDPKSKVSEDKPASATSKNVKSNSESDIVIKEPRRKKNNNNVKTVPKNRRQEPKAECIHVDSDVAPDAPKTTQRGKKRGRKGLCALCSTCPCRKPRSEETDGTLGVQSFARSDSAMEKALIRRLKKIEKSAENLQDQQEMIKRKLKKHRRDILRKKIKISSENKDGSCFLPDAQELESNKRKPPKVADDWVTYAQKHMFPTSCGENQPSLTQLGFSSSKARTTINGSKPPPSLKTIEEEHVVVHSETSEPIVGESELGSSLDKLDDQRMIDEEEDPYDPNQDEAREEEEGTAIDRTSPTKPHRFAWRNGTRVSSVGSSDAVFTSALLGLVVPSQIVEQVEDDNSVLSLLQEELPMGKRETCPWDRMFADCVMGGEINEMEQLVKLMNCGNSFCGTEAHESSRSISISTASPVDLTQGGNEAVKFLIEKINSEVGKVAALNQVCPNWKENISFAFGQSKGDIQNALRNLQESQTRLDCTREMILDAWKRNRVAMDVFKMALESSLERLDSREVADLPNSENE